MSQELSYLTQSPPCRSILAGKAMPELVGSLSRGIDPGPFEGMLDHRADGTLALEADYRCLRTEKHASTGGTRSPVSQVITDSRPNIRGDWQLGIAAALAA